jgi:hypothetical protein
MGQEVFAFGNNVGKIENKNRRQENYVENLVGDKREKI